LTPDAALNRHAEQRAKTPARKIKDRPNVKPINSKKNIRNCGPPDKRDWIGYASSLKWRPSFSFGRDPFDTKEQFTFPDFSGYLFDRQRVGQGRLEQRGKRHLHPLVIL